jgi:hypothetical protein
MLGLVVSLHRVLAAVLCLGFLAGNAAVCAGWAPTPEARKACCADGGGCPMHKGDPRDSSSHRMLTQGQADSCCASAEHENSNTANPAFVSAISIAVLGSGVILPPSIPAFVLRESWRTVSPIPATPVPRHVLLSVFLV